MTTSDGAAAAFRCGSGAYLSTSVFVLDFAASASSEVNDVFSGFACA
jgi:hypothetical protein